MNRVASKSSLADSTVSSRMNKHDNTHVIIQTPSDNNGQSQYITLPIENLVNFGRPLKVNELITYKIDLKSRGTSRGKIILFGNEDDCNDQIQVLSDAAGENQQEHFNAVVETFDTVDISSFDTEPLQRPIHRQKEKSKNNMNKQKSSTRMLEPTSNIKEKGGHQKQSMKAKTSINSNFKKVETTNKSKNTNRLNEEPAMTNQTSSKVITETQPFNTDRTVTNQKTLDQMLKKVPVVGKIPGSRSTISYKPIEKLSASKTSTLPSKSSSITTNNSKQMKQIDPQCSDNDGVDEGSQLNQMSFDLGIEDKDYYVKKYSLLFREHQALQAKYNKLVSNHINLKNNTIPMPNESVRTWIINLGKMFGPKKPLSTEAIANALGVDSASLIGCRQGTATHTARKVVKLIYTPEQLKSKRGPDMTPPKKNLIQDFVEQLHGVVVEPRPFKEAIYGVFRNTAHNEKKQNNTKQIIQQNPVQYGNDQKVMYADEFRNNSPPFDCQDDEEEYNDDGEIEPEDEEDI